MKKILTFTIILTLSAMALSCGKETQVVKVKPKRVDSLIDDRGMIFKYNLEAGKVEEYGRGVGKILLFGPILKRFAWLLAGISLAGSNGKAIELDPQLLDLSTLRDTDSKFIKNITIEKINLRIKDSKSTTSLAPFGKIEIYIDRARNFNLPEDELGRFQLLSFDEKRDGFGCDGKCLDLKIADLNIKELFFNSSNANEVILIPRFVINSVPTDTFDLAGEVIFSIKFNPGF